MRYRWCAATLLFTISTLLGAAGVASAPARAVAGEAEQATRSASSDLLEAWDSVTPVVELPSRGARTKSGDPRDLNELITGLASRTRFELQLPDPASLGGRPAQVVWWEGEGVVTGVEVLYEQPASSRPTYWSAGQMAKAKEDGRWRGARNSKPVATRFWKYRTGSTAGREGASSVEFYRFHDGVESWLGGQLSESEAAKAVASFRPVEPEGISPLVVLALGVVLIFVWPGYAAWSAKRKYDAKRDRSAAGVDGPCGPTT